MRDWTKLLISSTVAASLVSAFVSWLTSAQTIRLERWSRQGEKAYEELVKANALHWYSSERKPWRDGIAPEGAEDNPDELRQSNFGYTKARHMIAAYANASVVQAMSRYYAGYMGADKLCDHQQKFRADVQIYRAIRNTLGVGGNVTDNDLAVVIFDCSLI